MNTVLIILQVKEIQEDIEKLRKEKMWDTKKVCLQLSKSLLLNRAINDIIML